MRLANVSRITCALLIIAMGAILAQTPKKRNIAAQPDPYSWSPGAIVEFTAASGARGDIQKDYSILISGGNTEEIRPTRRNTERDTYTVVLETDTDEVSALRIEALTHPSLGGNGPGRTPHGNVVLSEVRAAAGPKDRKEKGAVKLAKAQADAAQEGLPAENAIDGNPRTGWAIQVPGRFNVDRALTITLASPVAFAGGSRWTITLDQQFGSNHTLGRFRILFGFKVRVPPAIPLITKDQIKRPPIKYPRIRIEAAKTPPLGDGNWDFETGIQGWTIAAESGDNRAFAAQPTYGDNVYAQRLRQGNVPMMGFDPTINTKIGGDYWDTPVFIGNQGDWWIGSSENRPKRGLPSGGRGSEDHRGSLISPDFPINKPVLSCLVSGAHSADVSVQLQVKCADEADRNLLIGKLSAEVFINQQKLQAGQIPFLPAVPLMIPDGQYLVITGASGRGNDVMSRVWFQLPAAVQGRIARYKVIDRSLTGHINVDDFRATDTLPADTTPVWGFVDTHSHPMIHMAFGGGFQGFSPSSNSLIWGSPGGNLQASMVSLHDMPDCDGFTHGNMKGPGNFALDMVCRFVGNFTGNFHRHGPGGFQNGFASWPAAGGMDGLLHQQMHVQWLRRAFEGGQRILVAAAINNQLLEKVAKNGIDHTGNKFTTPTAGGDFTTCMNQIIATKDLVAKNSTWMEIVTSPAEARRAINNNKLAVVLAVETDWLNDIGQVRALYNLGVRHITPVHLMDNLFGSSAVYKDLFNTLNAWYNGTIFHVEDGAPVGVTFKPERRVPILNWAQNTLTVPGLASGGDMFSHGYTVNSSFNPLDPAMPFSALKHSGFINRFGMKNYTKVIGGGAQPDPVVAYKEMMKMGMLIDVAHMSHKTVEEVLALAESQSAGSDRGYPLNSSHGGIREISPSPTETSNKEAWSNERSLTQQQCIRILAAGGTLGLGMGPSHIRSAPGGAVPNDAHGTSKSFAQLLQFSNMLAPSGGLTRGLTLGSDFNGLNGMMGPRFGPKAPPVTATQQNGVRYMNYVPPAGVSVLATQPIMRASTIISGKGTRTFDYNVDGLAHYGLMPDMFQDLRNTRLSADQLGTLFRGAEDFIRMWEKCDRLKSAIVLPSQLAQNPPITDPGQPPTTKPGSTTPVSTRKMTAFKPEVHGLRFGNDFTNIVAGDITSGGLCGGMSYLALDYFLASTEPPRQEYRPAHSTPLQAKLYERQVASLVPNIDKWVEINSDPAFLRKGEFFNWGVRERLTELRSFIDRGVPVPLGLDGLGKSDHQVLAIGYDLNGYSGDPSKGLIEKLKIFLCEPNHPKQTVTMVADPVNQCFYYLEYPEEKWRTYFVDGKYSRMPLPQLPAQNYPNDGLIHEVLLRFGTGFDGMAGGDNHVNASIGFADGTSQLFTNINQSGRWLQNYVERAQIILKTPKPQGTIRVITVTFPKPAFPKIADPFWKINELWVYVVLGNGKVGGEERSLYDYNVAHTFDDLRLPLTIFPPVPK